MRKPEILILNDFASVTGGSSAVAIASARGLAARGYRVTYFSCVGPVAPQLRDVPDLEVICLGQSELSKNPSKFEAFTSGLRNTRAVAALRAVLAGKDPAHTVVHAHTWMLALSPYALHEVNAMGFPLVLTLHDFFITCPSGGFYEHRAGALCTRRPLSFSCLTCNCDRRNYGHKLWRTARTVLQNGVLRVPAKVAHYVGVSHFATDLMRPYLPPATPVTIVRNPVDCVDEGPAPVAENERFLFVGRFVPDKGAGLFAEAVAATGLPATFIGDGALRPELERRCPHAEFTDWLTAPEIRRHLHRARALVFPPLWYETLGLVAIEAAAAGVPVIVADRCAATDFIADGKTGLHFAHGSASALGAAMQRLAQDRELARRLGAAAYAWYWAAPWSSENHVTELIPLYESLFTTPTNPVLQEVAL